MPDKTETKPQGQQESEEPSFKQSPSVFFMTILLVVIVWLFFDGAPYVADPGSLHGPFRSIIIGAIAVAVGVSAGTMTNLLFSLVYIREYRSSQEFFKLVAYRATIGAVLGTLLGVVSAATLAQNALVHHIKPSAFPGFMSLVGDVATFGTLFFIATCWRRSAKSVVEAIRKRLASLDSRAVYHSLYEPLGFMFVLSGMVMGAYVATAVFHILTH